MPPGSRLILRVTFPAAFACGYFGLHWWNEPFSPDPPEQANVGGLPDRLSLGALAPAGLVRPARTTAVIVMQKCATGCPYPVLPDSRLNGFDDIVILSNAPGAAEARVLAHAYNATTRPVTAALLRELDAFSRPKLLVYSKQGRLTYFQRGQMSWSDAVADYLRLRRERGP